MLRFSVAERGFTIFFYPPGCVNFSMATTAHPLTKKNILTAVQGVAWRKLGEVLLPWSSSLNKIEKQYQSNDGRLHAVVDRWLCGKGKNWEPSWRELIWLLDQADETRVADNMRHFAEPVLDSTLTVENVTEVMGEVRDWKKVGGFFGLEIPQSQLLNIEQQSSTEREKSCALGEYWVKTDPEASWEKLAKELHRCEEEKAAAMATQYFGRATSFPDGYLTMGALDCLEAVAGISIYNQLVPKYLTMAAALQLAHSTLNDLRAENNPVEGTKAMFEAWLSEGKSSVAPTWKTFLEKLDNIQMGELAQEITQFFNRTSNSTPSASQKSESKKEELELDMSEIERKELQTKPDCKDANLQTTPDYRDVDVQIKPECKDAYVQTMSDYRDVQIKPECKEVAVQNSPDFWKMGIQMQTAETTAETTGYIRGIQVIGETKFTVTTQGGSFEWKGYGLKLDVPKDSLPPGVRECRVNIRVSFSGQFQFSEDSELLSPVFWLTAPCKFIKPVTLEIQHCALRDEATLSGLSFVSAKCSQRSLPYKFRPVDGGVFTTHSSYGSIQLSHFSGNAVTGGKRTPQSYCAHLYHTMKKMYDWRYYFILTQDLNAKNTVVREHYGHFAKKEATLRIRFGGSEITLNIPADGLVTKEGWRITPFSFPTISRKDADQFEPGQWIPECQLIVEWEKEDQKPVRLRHKVDLIGAKAPCNFFHLTLNPAKEDETVRHSSTSGDKLVQHSQTPTPDLKGLMTALYHKVTNKWKMIGVQLEISDLDSIETKHRGDSHLCLLEVLDTWLKRVDPPPTWSAIIEAVEFLGEKQLGRELRESMHVLPTK